MIEGHDLSLKEFGLFDGGENVRRAACQARWARSRCTVPDTPLSSTGPKSANVIPVFGEASATV